MEPYLTATWQMDVIICRYCWSGYGSSFW